MKNRVRTYLLHEAVLPLLLGACFPPSSSNIKCVFWCEASTSDNTWSVPEGHSIEDARTFWYPHAEILIYAWNFQLPSQNKGGQYAPWQLWDFEHGLICVQVELYSSRLRYNNCCDVRGGGGGGCGCVVGVWCMVGVGRYLWLEDWMDQCTLVFVSFYQGWYIYSTIGSLVLAERYVLVLICKSKLYLIQ